MENKRIGTLVIRLNDNRLLKIEQSKFRQRLDELHNKFYENVVKKIKRSNENG